MGCVKKIEGRYSIRVEIEDDRQGKLSKGHNEDDRVGDELQQIDENSMHFTEFISSKLKAPLRFIEPVNPFNIGPQILRALHEGIFHFLEEEFCLQSQCLLLVAVELDFKIMHFLMLQQAVGGTMGNASDFD